MKDALQPDMKFALPIALIVNALLVWLLLLLTGCAALQLY